MKMKSHIYLEEILWWSNNKNSFNKRYLTTFQWGDYESRSVEEVQKFPQ